MGTLYRCRRQRRGKREVRHRRNHLDRGEGELLKEGNRTLDHSIQVDDDTMLLMKSPNADGGLLIVPLLNHSSRSAPSYQDCEG
jgi:hypothetical protein